MKATLTVLELDKKRQRIVTLTADSMTIGTTRAADIRLETHSSEFILEIKQVEEEWWLINPLRLRNLRVNGKAVSLEKQIQDGDEISFFKHQINFHIEEETKQRPELRFLKAPTNDQELWDYLLTEKEFDEVLINGPKNIIVDYQGNLHTSPFYFTSERFLVEKIAENTLTPSHEGWFSWQTNRLLRIHGALPPLTKEVHLSIRKAKAHVLALEELEKTAFGTPEEIRFLRRALKEQQNILICGGTSTGKTVLLRSLIEKVSPEERILMIEEEAETNWPHPHCVAIEAGRGNQKQAVVECLRMRPDRLIISEVRGNEAFDMLQAMNTGHPGSMTTIHANSTREALIRLETLALMYSPTLTSQIVRRQIAQAIDIVVHLERKSTGKRTIKEIVRLTGMQNDTLLLSDPIGLEADGIEQKVRVLNSTSKEKTKNK